MAIALEELRKLKKQQADIAKQLEDGKPVVLNSIEELAKEWGLSYADVKSIFQAPKRKRKSNGDGPQAKYKIPDGQSWAGTGANPPKEFVPFIKQNKLHDLCIEMNEKKIGAAKSYAANWNNKDKAKQKLLKQP
mgnify:CR=1 FL=1